LPDDGFYDALVLDLLAAIAPGDTLSGFSVEFDFLGSGTPGSQAFQFLTSSLELLDSGFTQRAVVTSVPEPGSLGLLAAGLAALIIVRKRSLRLGER
jgi:hypothetical protein